MASISVIIPCYNSAISLGRSIESALAQKVSDLEVIVVDDGSTDLTWDVANSYDERVRPLRQANKGQGAARNAGIAIATGELVAFLDADDYWLPGMLAECQNFLDSNPSAIAVSVATVVKKWGKNDQVIPVNSPEIPDSPIMIDDFFDFWARHDHIRTGSCVIRHEVIRIAGQQLSNLRISQDVEYWGYLATFGKWGFNPKPLFVTDGTPSAAVQGWLRKYRARRKLCPTVAEWQSRIIPRLSGKDAESFAVVRGRIAANFAHSRVLVGDSRSALGVVRKHGSEFPKSWSARAMNFGARSGGLAWFSACAMLQAREVMRAISISIRSKLSDKER